MSEPLELAALCEAILAVAGEPVGVDALVAAAGEGVTREQVDAALAQLGERHAQPGSGLLVERVGGGYRLATRPEHETALRAFLGLRSRTRLSQAALETLAVVAYKQPVTRADIEAIRGVQAGPLLRTLLQKGLVKITGRAEILGRPLLYGTTKKFLEYFGLKTLNELPRVEELPRP